MATLNSDERAELRAEYATGKWTVEELADIWGITEGLVHRLCEGPDPVKRSTSKSRLEHPRRCHARRTDGEPCRRYAIRGGVVCRVHGGAAPQVIANAREVLALNALHALRNLLGLADDADSEQVKLSANRDLLDRAGLGAKQSVEVELKPYEELLSDLGGIATISRAESRARRGLAPEPPALAGPEVVDAEVVDDPAPPDMGEPHPDSPSAGRTPADEGDGPPSRPAFAEGDVAPRPGTALVPMEDAIAATSPRYVRSQRIRRRR